MAIALGLQHRIIFTAVFLNSHARATVESMSIFDSKPIEICALCSLARLLNVTKELNDSARTDTMKVNKILT